MNSNLSSATSATQPPLAVVGLSALFPKAENLERFWSNIRSGVDAITEVPDTHWNPEDYFDSDQKAPDMTYARRGGFLSPVPFDPLEYGITPNNLEAIDTSQLLGLVGAKRALERAGYGSNRQFDRSRVGCILGVTGTLEMVIPLGARLGHPKWRKALKDAGVPDDVAEDVVQRISESYVPWQENSFPGLLGNVVAGRIANRLDLHGTNCVVDAACASSLSAIHLAALELWTGRSDMVVTGGIDTFNDIFMFMCFSKTPALSPTGDSKPFSDEADGTILGEGVGIVVLKRLSDAERDGDRIYAVLRGIGTSSDGAGNAVYAPKAEGQIRCLQDAYRVAGVTPDTIELVEAHGTGTKVGDATEVSGLMQVYQSTGRKGPWCAVGSIKSQIGHTKAAAGAAGIIKAILALQHRVLPPTIKVNQPPAALLAEDSPFYVNTEARPWLKPSGYPRRAAVSAFGFGGSNFHCVLEESPQRFDTPDWDGDVQIVALSATNSQQILDSLQPLGQAKDWADIRQRAAASRATFRAEHPQRLLLVIERDKTDIGKLVASAATMLEKYADRAHWSTPDGAYYGRGSQTGRLAVLFPGQGSQYVGMLRELTCRFPVMNDVLTEANDVFASRINGHQTTRKLSDYIYPTPSWNSADRDARDSELRATQIAQPAIGAVSLGALAILEQFGVRPEAAAGHSYGELTALCASQRFAPRTLYRLSMLRGQLMAQAQEVEGGMLAVGAPLTQVEAAIKEMAVDLVVANHNSPNQVVLSGRIPEIDRATQLFSQRNLRGKKLQVAAAFHSPLVATASRAFRPELEEVEFAPSRMPVYANSTATEYPADPNDARDLLATQLARPVNFVHEIEQMYADGVRTFLEVGPGAVLTGLVNSILSNREFRAVAIDSSNGRRGGVFDLAHALAQLSASGHSIRLEVWDSPNLDQTPVGPTKRLQIPICGANYVKPRATLPPRPIKTEPSVVQLPVSESRTVPAPEPQSPPIPDVIDTIQENLKTLRQMQEETARLHQRFLESQESALRTFEELSRRQLDLATMGPRSVRPVIQPKSLEAVPVESHVAPSFSKPTSSVASTPAVAQTESNQSWGEIVQQIEVKNGQQTTVRDTEMTPPPVAFDYRPSNISPAPIARSAPVQPAIKPHPEYSAFAAPVSPTAISASFIQPSHTPSRTVSPEPPTPPTQHIAPVAQPASAPRGPNSALTTAVLAVVSEKTGYPTEMLNLDMSLDHDLGIDSIKRVEILSALQEKIPNLPAFKPDELGSLHTLNDVVTLADARCGDVLASACSVPNSQCSEPPVTIQAPPVSSPQPSSFVGAPSSTLTAAVLAVVSEKTGYPTEMLNLDMSLDHDLGIDSIKRVEILSALQEKIPNLPAFKPDELGSLHTLNDVVTLADSRCGEMKTECSIQSSSCPEPNALPVPAAPTSAPVPVIHALSSSRSSTFTNSVLAVVSEKTGYPTEMLNLEMSLDHDLGIDSIKRVEILSALQEKIPNLPAFKPDELGSLHTLNDVVTLAESRCGEVLSTPQIIPGVSLQSVPKPPANVDATFDEISRRCSQPATLVRSVVRAELLPPASSMPEASSVRGAEIWITEDGLDFSLRIAAELSQRGFKPRVVDLDQPIISVPERLAGLIVIAPAQGTTDRQLWRAIEWLQKAGPSLRRTAKIGATVFATVSRLNGRFGIDAEQLLTDPVSGGLAGLVKSAAREWPEIRCKAFDMASDWESSSDGATALVDDLFRDGPIEVGLSPQGRFTPVVCEESLDAHNAVVPDLRPGELIVVSGGARGVTAAAALAVARKWKPRLVILGRSPESPQEPDWLKELTSEAEIKQALIRVLPKGTLPKAVESQYRQIIAGREITSTLEQLRAIGIPVSYHAVDVRDMSIVRPLLMQLQGQFGPIRGLIHGAGVLADQRIEEKTRENFDRVYQTKVAGLRNLLSAVAPDQLRVMAIFSSYTARYGRVGQCDYAIANEVLNKMARQFSIEHPMTHVVSFNWGPWDGGMVTGGLKNLFAAENVGLIPLQDGADLLVEEFSQETSHDVEVLVLGRLGSVNSESTAKESHSAIDHPVSKHQGSSNILLSGNAATAPQGNASPPERQLGSSNVLLTGSAAPRSSDQPPPLPGPSGSWVFAEIGKYAPTEVGELKVAFERAVDVRQYPFLESHVIGGKAVLPVAIILEWLAHGAIHHNPGLDLEGFDDLRVYNGVRLERAGSVTLRVMVGKPVRAEGRYVLRTQLVGSAGDREVVHASANLILTSSYPVSPDPILEIPLFGYSLDMATAYATRLFHGTHLQGIAAVEGCSPEGIVVDSRTSPAPWAWMRVPLRSAWIADPMAIDAALQAIILWSQEIRGLPCLPCSIGSYRQYCKAYPHTGVRIVVRVNQATNHAIRADVEFLDLEGMVVAQMSGCESISDAALVAAFKRNRLE